MQRQPLGQQGRERALNNATLQRAQASDTALSREDQLLLESTLRAQERAAAARLAQSVAGAAAAPRVEVDEETLQFLLAPLGPGGRELLQSVSGAAAEDTTAVAAVELVDGAAPRAAAAAGVDSGASSVAGEYTGAVAAGGSENEAVAEAEGGPLVLSLELVAALLERHPDPEVRQQVRRVSACAACCCYRPACGAC